MFMSEYIHTVVCIFFGIGQILRKEKGLYTKCVALYTSPDCLSALSRFGFHTVGIDIIVINPLVGDQFTAVFT